MEEDLKCDKHSTPATFYCKSSNCMYGICKDCGFYHLGHEKNLSINDPKLPSSIKQDIENYIARAEELQNENQQIEQWLQTMLKSIKDETKDLVLQIKKYFIKIQEAAKQREQELINNAEEISKNLQEIVTHKISECQNVSFDQKEKIDMISKFFEEFKTLNDRELIYKSYHVFNKFPIVKPLVLSEKYELYGKFSFDENLLQEISQAGHIFSYKDSLASFTKANFYFFKEFCKQIYKYEIDSDEWSVMQKPLIPSFQNLSSSYIPEKNLYILIGNSGGKSMLVKFHLTYLSTEEEILNFEYPQWCSCIYYKESLYLIGGEANDSSSSVCRRYCPKTFT